MTLDGAHISIGNRGLKPGLIYAACPSRLTDRTRDICDYVRSTGNACLHPFAALPFEYFEGTDVVGRTQTLHWCCRLIEAADAFWIFGVSEGTLLELEHAIALKRPVTVMVGKFDRRWRGECRRFAANYPIAVDYLLTRTARGSDPGRPSRKRSVGSEEDALETV